MDRGGGEHDQADTRQEQGWFDLGITVVAIVHKKVGEMFQV